MSVADRPLVRTPVADLRRAVCCALACVVATPACADPPRPVHPTAPAPLEPAPVARIVAPEPEPTPPPTEPSPEPPPLDPEVARADGRVTVTIHAPVEELLVTPYGLVWTHDGAVWAALDERAGAELLARQADPHGLAGDDNALYWAGAERHVRHTLATGEQTEIPGLDPRFMQVQGFAVGPPLAALVDRPIALWRVRWPGPRLELVRLRADPEWQRASDLRAGGGSLFFSVLTKPAGGSPETSIVAVDARGRARARPTGQRRLSQGAWDVDARGVVVLVADGQLHRLGPQDASPRPVLALPDATMLCWCGPRVCSVDAKAREIQARDLRSGAVTTLASEADPVVRLACGSKQVAWATDTRIVAVPTRTRPGP